MIGQFALINFLKTGALQRKIADQSENQTDPPSRDAQYDIEFPAVLSGL